VLLFEIVASREASAFILGLSSHPPDVQALEGHPGPAVEPG
jgi:hypothetical protein